MITSLILIASSVSLTELSTLKKNLTASAEPNTYSKVIGYIKKGQKLYWDRKSISQDNEWVNFGSEHQCGYMIGINKDGKYNIVPESIVEKKEEKKRRS